METMSEKLVEYHQDSKGRFTKGTIVLNFDDNHSENRLKIATFGHYIGGRMVQAA